MVAKATLFIGFFQTLLFKIGYFSLYSAKYSTFVTRTVKDGRDEKVCIFIIGNDPYGLIIMW